MHLKKKLLTGTKTKNHEIYLIITIQIQSLCNQIQNIIYQNFIQYRLTYGIDQLCWNQNTCEMFINIKRLLTWCLNIVPNIALLLIDNCDLQRFNETCSFDSIIIKLKHYNTLHIFSAQQMSIVKPYKCVLRTCVHLFACQQANILACEYGLHFSKFDKYSIL